MNRLGGVFTGVLGLGIAFASCSPRFKIPTMHGMGGDASGGAPESQAGDAGESSDSGGSGTEQLPGVAGAAAGEGPATEALLTVVSVTPNDGDTGVERDAPVQVTFSRDIDPTTVTSSSFRVEGPNGAVVGKLNVEHATVTFVADAKWSLLADYKVHVDATIGSGDATLLNKAYTFEFQGRDGVFGEPKRLLSREYNYFPKPIGTTSGYVALHWADSATPPSMLMKLFDPRATAWNETKPATSDAVNTYSDGCLGVNELGHAFIVSGYPTEVWNRFDGSMWGTPKGMGAQKGDSYCALADDETAVIVWSSFDGSKKTLSGATLSPTGTLSSTKELWVNGTVWGVRRLGDGFIVFITHDDDDSVYAHVYQRSNGWLTPQAVTQGGGSAAVYDTGGSVAALLWNTSTHLVKASVFDGKGWKVHDLGPSSTLARNVSVGTNGLVVVWVTEMTAYAARYSSMDGWGEPVKLGAAMMDFDHGMAVGIDSSGNTLAAWPKDGSITWRRASHATGKWSEIQKIEDQDALGIASTVDASGNVMLVWSNALGVWASRFD